MADPSRYPTPRCPRYDSLDFWRGVACLMIVVAHAQAFKLEGVPEAVASSSRALAGVIGWPGVALNKVASRLDVGVSIFFVISGYCIAATCDSSRRKSQSFGVFYLRRFRRIFPPYWIYLGLIALLFAALALLRLPTSILDVGGVVLNDPWHMSFPRFTGTFLLTSTWQDRLLSQGGMVSGQAWSLCYEEQFYLVCGLLLWWSPRRLYLGVAAVSAAVLVLFVAAPGLGLDLHGFFFDGFWLLFAAGFLVFYRVNYCSGRSRWAADGALVLLLGLLIATTSRADSRWYNIYFFPSGAAFALLLCGLHPWDAALASSRLLRPITSCGRMCYSLYLIHYPIAAIVARQLHEAGVRGFWPTMLVTVPVVLALSIGAAHVFAVLVERRFLNPPNVAPRAEKPAEAAPRIHEPVAVPEG